MLAHLLNFFNFKRSLGDTLITYHTLGGGGLLQIVTVRYTVGWGDQDII